MISSSIHSFFPPFLLSSQRKKKKKMKMKMKGKKVSSVMPKESPEVIVFDDPTKRRNKPQFDEGGSRGGKIVPIATVNGVTGVKGGAKGGAGSESGSGGNGNSRLEGSDIDESSRKITERLLKEVEEFSEHII